MTSSLLSNSEVNIRRRTEYLGQQSTVQIINASRFCYLTSVVYVVTAQDVTPGNEMR